MPVFIVRAGNWEFMEIWHVVVICILMFPAFFILNYLVVVRAARERRERDLLVDKTIASRVGSDYRERRFVTRRYRSRKPGRKT
jgi:hypothetical protein